MHLYFHVPFCARRCSYCDFSIAVRRVVPSEGYVEAIAREWELWTDHPAWGTSPQVDTIYLGGGTPSRLAPEAIARIIALVRGSREVAPDAELTLEANPDDVTAESAHCWVEAGINRVSLGAQSFDPAVLDWMHRTHRAEQVGPAVATLRAAGIADVSLDLIFALPASLRRDWAQDLDAALALEPTHLSLYGLTIEPHTPLGHWARRGETQPAEDDTYALEFLHTARVLRENGWDHYEVSNAARPGHRSRHNSAYWRRAPFIGLGPSAHSGFGAERQWNIREWEAWRAAVTSGKSPVAGHERLERAATRLEDLYLGLRTVEGADRELIPTAALAAWQESGWARVAGSRALLTPEGWLRLDALVAQAA